MSSPLSCTIAFIVWWSQSCLLANGTLRQQVQALRGKVLQGLTPVIAEIKDQVDAEGRTALHYSAILGDLDLTRFFLEIGVDPMIKDRHDKYPFNYLVERAEDPLNPNSSTYALIASYVLEKMPSRHDLGSGHRAGRGGIHQRDNKGWTPLVWAVAAGNKERIIELLDAGVEVIDKGVDRTSTKQYLFKVAEITGDQEIINLLVDRLRPLDIQKAFVESVESGVSLPTRNKIAGRLSGKHNKNNMLKEILRSLSFLNMRHLFVNSFFDFLNELPSDSLEELLTSSDIWNVLWLYAISNEDVRIIDGLLSSAKPNTRQWEVDRMFRLSVSMGRTKLFDHLLANGANINSLDVNPDKVWSTPLANLIWQSPFGTKEFKAMKISDSDTDTIAEVAKVLLALGADPNIEKCSYPPLGKAAHKGHLLLCRELIAYGAHINAVSHKYMNTALHWVAKGDYDTKDKPQIAQLLIDNGADVNAINGDGNTPLHLAVSVFYWDWRKKGIDHALKMVEVLLANGADKNQLDSKNMTALERFKKYYWDPFYGRIRDAKGYDKMIALLEG